MLYNDSKKEKKAFKKLDAVPVIIVSPQSQLDFDFD